MDKIEEIKKLILKKNSQDNKKAKKLGMRNKIKLGKLRNGFCQKCYEPLDGRVRIKRKCKTITCRGCGKIKRLKFLEFVN